MTFHDYRTLAVGRGSNVGQAFQPDVRLESLTYVAGDLAGPFFCFRGVRGGEPQVAEFQT